MTQEPEDRKLNFSLPPRDRAITFKAPKSLIFLYVLVLLAILVDIGIDMGFTAWTPESPRSATTEGSSLSPDAQKGPGAQAGKTGFEPSLHIRLGSIIFP